MTYDEFLVRIKGLGIDARTTRFGYSSWRREKEDTVPPYIYIEWSTGGMTGGSCWNDDSPHAYTSSDTEPEFTDLDMILGEFNPSITYLQYKNLAANVIESDDYSQPEYYGNCTNYAIKKVDLKKLYDYLESKEWLK